MLRCSLQYIISTMETIVRTAIELKSLLGKRSRALQEYEPGSPERDAVLYWGRKKKARIEVPVEALNANARELQTSEHQFRRLPSDRSLELPRF